LHYLATLQKHLQLSRHIFSWKDFLNIFFREKRDRKDSRCP
jgi:hypothetical protein